MSTRFSAFRSLVAVIMLIFVALALSACATTGTTPGMTPKQVATIALNTYNSEYDDTMATMTNPAATQAQRDIALKKRAILVQMWPALKIYSSTVDNGGIPSAADTAAINSFVDQLAALAATGGK